MAKIGELLMKKGWLTSDQLNQALQESQRGGEIIGKVLVRKKFISEEQLLEALGDQMALPYYPTLQGIAVSPEVIKAVPAKLVWHYRFMPLKLEERRLTIAISDPLAVWPMEDLRLHLGFQVERVLATEREILAAIKRFYGVVAETVDEILGQQEAALERQAPVVEEIEDLAKSAQDASVIKLVNQILAEAVDSRASDIHVEPYRDAVRVRYRIDGLLYEMRVPEQIRRLQQAIVSRIKILSNLNVVERRLPQDGRAIIKIKDKQVDLRISILPSQYGENVVVRILPMHLLFNLKELGVDPADLEILEKIMERPHGVIFLTGPTGSGKTTTLYACLSRLNKESVKIITIEDPIEYELMGVVQIHVRPEIGLTFANALRSILRHDPDILMVGEVRDLETAELAIRTALTGHLIFSTLHTNDACSGATRLLDIGIEPYLVASSVIAFLAQRLVRVLCPSCKTERKDKAALPAPFRDLPAVWESKGCEHCKFIGYQGRTAIYEIVVIHEAIQQLILAKAAASEIRKKSKELGFRTLREAGVEAVRKGITTPEEVLRVTQAEE